MERALAASLVAEDGEGLGVVVELQELQHQSVGKCEALHSASRKPQAALAATTCPSHVRSKHVTLSLQARGLECGMAEWEVEWWRWGGSL